jgi:hypothetical protein
MKKEGANEVDGLSEAKGGKRSRGVVTIANAPTIFEVESDELLFRNHQEEVSIIK